MCSLNKCTVIGRCDKSKVEQSSHCIGVDAVWGALCCGGENFAHMNYSRVV